MSVEDITAVLLPTSQVDFFLLDEGTSNLVTKLKADWRFARVAIEVDKSGIEAAVERYQEAGSPELIVIETNDLGKEFLEQLETLAAYCSKDTDAIIIGPQNDVRLYRDLVGMGVKDYLVRPVSEEDMVKVVAKTLVEKRGLSESRLVTVIGSKGGVGTTSIAQALAWNITNTLQQKAMLLDVAGSASSIGIPYEAESSARLTEAVRIADSGSDEDMERIYQKVNDYLSLLVCGSVSVFNNIPEPDSVELLIKRIMQKYPVLVVDLSGTSHAVQKRLIELSSEVVVVTTPMISSLRNARALLNEIKVIRAGTNVVDLVVNMKGIGNSEEVPMDDIHEALDMSPACVVNYLPKVFAESETMGKPIGEIKEAEGFLKKMLSIAEKSTAIKSGEIKKEKQSVGFLQSLIKKLSDM